MDASINSRAGGIIHHERKVKTMAIDDEQHVDEFSKEWDGEGSGDEANEGEAEAGAGAETGGEQGGEAKAEPKGEEKTEDGGQDKTGGTDETDEEERRRANHMKEWEGRLKAREEEQRRKAKELEMAERERELAEREAKLAAAEKGGEKKKGGEDGEVGDEDEDVAELKSTFGDKFTDAVMKVAGKKVSEELKKQRIADHFSRIADAHEDYEEVVGSKGFSSYIAGLPDDEKKKAEAVVEKGTAKQVINLISGYKKSREKAAAEEKEQAAAEKPAAEKPAAEKGKKMSVADESGVRSATQRPKTSAAKGGAESYSDAWDEF